MCHYVLLCFLVFIMLEAAVAQDGRKQTFTMKKEQRRIGEVIHTTSVTIPEDCALICMANSCRSYNVVHGNEEILCEILGDQTQLNITDNAQSNYYCEL